MVFVPIVPPQRPPSARALDLGRRLKAEIEKFEAQYPGTSAEDIRAAAGIATGEGSGRAPVNRQVKAALLGLVAVFGALGVALSTATSAGGGGDKGPALVAVGIASIGAILAVRLFRRNRG